MNIDEAAVARHYGDAGLLARIDSGLEAQGVDPDEPTIDDLAPIDEFHIGGRTATEYALAMLVPQAGQHLLDVGCGIGGTARLIASRYGCSVHGIDLTPEYIDVARVLTDRVGLGASVGFDVANALAMDFNDNTFDGAVTMHVAMNIADREGLYGEIARVMKPGAMLCVYDLMKKGDEALVFPVPWAETEATSHLITPDQTATLLDDAGLDVTQTDDRTDAAIAFFQKLASAADADAGKPTLGVHLLMGDTWREKFRNVTGNIENRRVSPVVMIANRRP